MRTREEVAVIIDKYMKYVQEETSILSIILKGQLLIEAEIEKLIDNALFYSEVLNLDRMFLPNKIDLLVATGALTVEEGNAYKVFNKTRRNYAHDIDYEISLDEVIAIENAFSDKHNKVNELYFSYKDFSIEERLKRIILILLVLLLSQNCIDPLLGKNAGDEDTIEDLERYYRKNRENLE